MDQRKAVSSSGPRKPFRWVLTLVGPMLVGSFAACGGGDDAVGLPSFAAGASRPT